MSRNLLAKHKLEAFLAWMTEQGIEHRPGRGEYQIVQVKDKNGQWQCVFDRLYTHMHYTVADPIEHIVRRFIKDTRDAALNSKKESE